MVLYAVDIDGTVADARKRYKLAGPEPKCKKTSKRYQAWIKKIMNKRLMAKDPLVPGIAEILSALDSSRGRVVFVTSREERHRGDTSEWLDRNGLWMIGCGMVMRPDGNLLPDAELKEEAIKRMLEVYPAHQVVVLDDDLSGNLAKVCTKNQWLMLKVQGYSL